MDTDIEPHVSIQPSTWFAWMYISIRQSIIVARIRVQPTSKAFEFERVESTPMHPCPFSQKQRNTDLTLAHAQTILYK